MFGNKLAAPLLKDIVYLNNEPTARRVEKRKSGVSQVPGVGVLESTESTPFPNKFPSLFCGPMI